MQFKTLKVFLEDSTPIRPTLGGEGSERPPDPPATFGCANARMLATIAFQFGASQAQF